MLLSLLLPHKCKHRLSQPDSTRCNTGESSATTDVSDPRAQGIAAQQTASSVWLMLQAAQGNAIQLANPPQREIREGELIDPVANAEKAKTFTEQIEAATSSP